MSEPKRLDSLPVFPSRPAPREVAGWRLHVGGLVATPLALAYREIRSMPSTELIADFGCEEGWEVRDLRWTGVPLAHPIELAGPLREARYVAVGSGKFVAVLPLEQIEKERALLAYLLDGAPVSWEHGGPLRLVLAEGPCYQSVKWVERLELTADDSAETARRTALTRLNREERR